MLKKSLRGVGSAPLSHAQLDKSGPWLRGLLGVALLAYTGYTTVSGVGTDFAPLLAGTPAWAPLAAGLGVALLLSLGQWLTSETVPIIYVLLLLIDARYTQRQLGPWIEALAAYHLSELGALWTSVVSFLVSWGVSIAAARYGEILLFGRRGRAPSKEG